MTRTTVRTLKLVAVLSTLAAVGYFVDPIVLFAAVPVLGTVGDGGPGDDDADGDDPAGDDPDPDAAHDADADEDADDEGEDDDPDADPDGTPGKAGTGTPGKGDKTVPAYRLRQMRERFERQLSEESGKNRQLLERLTAAIGGKPADGSQSPALTDHQKKLRGEFLKVFPEFANLLDVAPRAKDLIGLADRAPEWEKDTNQYWGQVATGTSARLHGHVAKELGTKTLDAETRGIVSDAFVSWVKADRTGDRNYRYEGQDESLIGDFWTFYAARFRAPQQRPGNAAALRRAASTTNLPRGGNSSTQVPGAPRRKPKTDEDPFEAVNDRAWGQLQDDQAGQR